MSTKIIINADDFGYNNIINYIKNGLITSTSILVNGESFEEAINYAITNKNISYGIHLNLTEFSPIHESGNTNLLNYNKFRLSNYYNINYNDLNYIYEEWCFQIEKFLSTGLTLSYVNSHHHIHTRPELFYLLKKLILRYNISSLRICRNLFVSKLSYKYWYKVFWNYLINNTTPKIYTVDYFCSLEEFVKGKFNFDNNIFKDKIIELMCHPGNLILNDSDLEYFELFRNNFELINYNNLFCD
jgi:predicted glycoside hydrolase/deacetylase ChbG (UPF0249 family)